MLAVTVTACGTQAAGHTGATAAHASGPAAGTRVITDAAGRHVRVPGHITRVAAIGTIPVMISFVFAAGEQRTIVTRGGQGGVDSIAANGKPGIDSTALYQAFAPNILSSRSVEAAIDAPVNAEALLAVHPDVVLAPDTEIAQGAISAGLPVVILSTGRTGPDVEKDIAVMGALFNKPQLARSYTTYFSHIVQQVQAGVSSIPPSQRYSAVFLAFSPLRLPIYSTNYMFPIDGARSVTAGNGGSNVQISVEQLLRWNPDIIVVQQEADQYALYTDPTYASLKAVRTHRVVLIPQAIQTWTDNSPEMPLGLLYLAREFYPNRFQKLDLIAEVQSFFQQFSGFHVSDQQAMQILESKIG